MKIVNSKNIGYVSGAQVSPDQASKYFTGVIRGDLCSRNVANIFRANVIFLEPKRSQYLESFEFFQLPI